MITLSEAVAEFLLDAEARLRPRTVATYAYVLRPLVEHFAGRALTEISVNDMRRYVVALRQQDTRYHNAPQRPEEPGSLSDETVRSRVRQLKAFFNWCAATYALPSPMVGVKMPRAPQHLPKAASLDDLRKLLQACDDSQTGRRDRAMLAFLADTGARAGGVVSLTLDNLHLDRLRAIVNEKGDRARVVPFGPLTAQWIREWLAVRPPSAPTVFCSLRQQSYGAALTVSGLNQALERLKIKAGVQGRVNPHSYRHGFAREWLRNHGDMSTLSRILGHSSPDVTLKFYAVFAEDEALDAHRRYSPLRVLEEVE